MKVVMGMSVFTPFKTAVVQHLVHDLTHASSVWIDNAFFKHKDLQAWPVVQIKKATDITSTRLIGYVTLTLHDTQIFRHP